MTKKVFDIAIIGSGVAGACAAYKLATEYPDVSAILFDIGSAPQKRKPQMNGYLGVFPSSDGKLYLNDVDKTSNLIGLRAAKRHKKEFFSLMNLDEKKDKINDNEISKSLNNQLTKLDYNIEYNDYLQVFPKDIHTLSKHMSLAFDDSNIQISFEDEVFHIEKENNIFHLSSESGEYQAKKIILAVGRSGWRWARDVFSNFDIIDANDYAKFGVRLEITADSLKNFNESNCTLTRKDIELGPFCWNGTVIPEDHVDLVISSFRSNENRWKTDKVSFNLIKSIKYPNNGFEETDRLGKLTFILANDRVIKEKISTLFANKSKISILKEYDWVTSAIKDLTFIPELEAKGYFHVPTITPLAPKINLGSNLESEVEGLYVVGESAGVTGILSAAITGLLSIDSICKVS